MICVYIVKMIIVIELINTATVSQETFYLYVHMMLKIYS